MPGALSSVLAPSSDGAPSSVLAPSSDARSTWNSSPQENLFTFVQSHVTWLPESAQPCIALRAARLIWKRPFSDGVRCSRCRCGKWTHASEGSAEDSAKDRHEDAWTNQDEHVYTVCRHVDAWSQVTPGGAGWWQWRWLCTVCRPGDLFAENGFSLKVDHEVSLQTASFTSRVVSFAFLFWYWRDGYDKKGVQKGRTNTETHMGQWLNPSTWFGADTWHVAFPFLSPWAFGCFFCLMSSLFASFGWRWRNSENWREHWCWPYPAWCLSVSASSWLRLMRRMRKSNSRGKAAPSTGARAPWCWSWGALFNCSLETQHGVKGTEAVVYGDNREREREISRKPAGRLGLRLLERTKWVKGVWGGWLRGGYFWERWTQSLVGESNKKRRATCEKWVVWGVLWCRWCSWRPVCIISITRGSGGNLNRFLPVGVHVNHRKEGTTGREKWLELIQKGRCAPLMANEVVWKVCVCVPLLITGIPPDCAFFFLF